MANGSSTNIASLIFVAYIAKDNGGTRSTRTSFTGRSRCASTNARAPFPSTKVCRVSRSASRIAEPRDDHARERVIRRTPDQRVKKIMARLCSAAVAIELGQFLNQ